MEGEWHRGAKREVQGFPTFKKLLAAESQKFAKVPKYFPVRLPIENPYRVDAYEDFPLRFFVYLQSKQP